MSITARELWAALHGMIFGALFLLAFAGGLAGLYSLRPEWVTVEGLRERFRRLLAGTWIMAVVAWITVISGTYVVYPWYRAKAPEGADLTAFPRLFLLSKPETKLWHTFAFEWKEHIGWFAPILATAVAFVVAYYGPQLTQEGKLRKVLLGIFSLAFVTAAVAGLFGAFVTKIAPIR